MIDEAALLLEMLSRAEWGGGAPPRPYVTFADNKYVGTETHHTVYPAASRTIAEHCQAVEKQHLGQGWNGGFYAHLIHGHTGEIGVMRDFNNAQGTKTSWGDTGNGRMHVVAFAADLRTDTLTEAAWRSWRLLRALMQQRAAVAGQINATASWGHKRRPNLPANRATYCPGDTVSDLVATQHGRLIHVGPNERQTMEDLKPWETAAIDWAIAAGVTSAHTVEDANGHDPATRVEIMEMIRKYDEGVGVAFDAFDAAHDEHKEAWIRVSGAAADDTDKVGKQVAALAESVGIQIQALAESVERIAAAHTDEAATGAGEIDPDVLAAAVKTALTGRKIAVEQKATIL